ncbi:MAG: aminopeptidase [Nitrospinota bacterium]
MTLPLEMMSGARLCVETCMGVQPDETVLVITDREYEEQAQAVAVATHLAGAEPIVMTIPARRYYEKEPPPLVAKAMKEADVVLLTMPQLFSHFLYHTTARKEATDAGVRLANVWLTPENWGLTAEEIIATRDLSVKVQGLLTKAKEARLRSASGTDLKLGLEGREAIMLSGLLTQPGESGAIPDYAEAAIAPMEGTAEGFFKVDASMLGVGLMKEPMTLRIKEGRLVEIEGGEERERLRKVLEKADDNAYNIAELGIGTVSRGNITGAVDDKKLLGTAHVAVGDNHSIGGIVVSNIHLDAVTIDASLELDGKAVIQDGKLVV